MIKKVRGFRDIFGEDIPYWQHIEKSLQEVFSSYGFKEFRLPILEQTALFSRGIGEATDIVEKEMFSFIDSDEPLSMRPEGTAGLMRAYIENNLSYNPGVKKYYYLGNMFRRERPQKGRFRQFTQLGVEALESASPLLDAEVISLLYNCAVKLGLDSFSKMEINSIGCPTCRANFRKALISFFKEYEAELCGDCKRRLNLNPLRLLDCKEEKCRAINKNAPSIKDYLCDDCKSFMDNVENYLQKMHIPYIYNERIVRGLDYYIRTAFELTTDMLGSASAIGAGGRYDGLIKSLGGPDIPGIGFAIGLDRCVELLKLNEGNKIVDNCIDAFVIAFQNENFSSVDSMLSLVASLRNSGLKVEFDYALSGMKSQMKKANKSGARNVIILGEDEVREGNATVKNLESGEQELLKFNELSDRLKNCK